MNTIYSIWSVPELLVDGSYRERWGITDITGLSSEQLKKPVPIKKFFYSEKEMFEEIKNDFKHKIL